MLSPQAALIYTMVVAAESDEEIAEREIAIIGDLVNHLPVFEGVGRHEVVEMATACSELLASAGGRKHVLEQVRAALPDGLRATAYTLACDVIAADNRLHRNEMQILADIRGHLGVDLDMAAIIERVTQARFQAA